MFPLKDDNPTARFPAFTLGLILVNVVIFLSRLFLSAEGNSAVIRSFAFYPILLTGGTAASLPTLVTSQFLHGDLFHLGGNMLYLWIFGNNIEDILGRARFLFFYLGCGVIAALAQWLAAPHSPVPTIGASGAIAGVLGAYAISFPRARVHTLIILFLFVRIVPVPAGVWLGIWFVFQLLAAAFGRMQAGGGIAWFAHLGGFVAGLLLIRLILPRRPRPAPPLFAGGSWLAR